METTIDPLKLESAAHILKTIAHPTRLAIIDLLHQHKELSVNDICEKLGGSDQSLTSHHLANMKMKGVLRCRREVINCLENCKINF